MSDDDMNDGDSMNESSNAASDGDSDAEALSADGEEHAAGRSVGGHIHTKEYDVYTVPVRMSCFLFSPVRSVAAPHAGH